MVDPIDDGAAKRRRLWVIVLVVLAIAASFWFARPLGVSEKVEPARPQAQSTEWAEEPDGEKVPVNLPNTPMLNAEEQPKGEVDKAKSKAE